MSNVLITGASSGFGRFTAETLAKSGHTVFATMRQPAGKNAPAAQALKAVGTHVLELDVTSDASVDQAVEAVARQTGGAIDVLFNNAGRLSAGIQEAFTLDEIKSLFETNVFGPLRMNRAVLPYMRKRRSGLLISTSSVVGRIALPILGTYAATKFALEALADAQRDEVKGFGIDVVVIEAGAHPTEVGNNGLYPTDAARAAEYGTAAQLPGRLVERLGQIFSAPGSPSIQDVADAVNKIIETPPGQRPARVVVDKLTGDAVRRLNDVHAEQRPAFVAAYNLS
jgi:NAD(P)-dependent dehydrogenase (short-subunit alcohol dehydrogenase family)